MNFNKKGLSKGVIIGIIVGVVLVLAAGILYFALTDNVSVATLKVNQGEVMLDSGTGYNLITGEVSIDEGDKIKTGADGKATLVLYESLIQIIQPGSELTIDKLDETDPRVSLDSGKTWTKFTGLTGMKNFEIETPNSVAIVRGTGYTTDPNGVKVIDGVVEVKTLDGTIYRAEAGKAVIFENGSWIERNLTTEEKAELLTYLQESVQTLKEIRQGIIDENPFVIDLAKKASGMNEEELKDYLESMDRGEKSVEDLYDNSPIKNEIIVRIAEITKSIQKENELINSLS